MIATKTETQKGIPELLFAFDITLWFKSRKKRELHDGYLSTDKTDVFFWICRRDQNERGMTLIDNEEKKKVAEIKKLAKVTYKEMGTNTDKTIEL